VQHYAWLELVNWIFFPDQSFPLIHQQKSF